MSESRIAQLATSPLLTNYAITASQKAIRPVGNFIAPICEVPDDTFRYKIYSEENRFRIPNTTRQPGAKATVIGFSASDATGQLQPNALDFPIPNVDGLSDEGLQFAIMEAQDTLADVSGLALESQILTTAQASAAASPLSMSVDFTDNTVDPIAIIDGVCLQVMKASKNGAPIKLLFGATKFKQFRNNANVRNRFIVSNRPAAAANVGLVSPTISDASGLFMVNPETQVSYMVVDESAQGLAANIQFLLDTMLIIFASNSTPNRMDPSFMKTFARMGGFFKPGTYLSEDQRDEILKMDWTTDPTVTNAPASAAIM